MIATIFDIADEDEDNLEGDVPAAEALRLAQEMRKQSRWERHELRRRSAVRAGCDDATASSESLIGSQAESETDEPDLGIWAESGSLEDLLLCEVDDAFPKECPICCFSLDSQSFNVLRHCECPHAQCRHCTLRSVASDKDTYHRGIECFFCRLRTPLSPLGVRDCRLEEKRLLRAAAAATGLAPTVLLTRERLAKLVESQVERASAHGLPLGAMRLCDLWQGSSVGLVTVRQLRLEAARYQDQWQQRTDAGSAPAADQLPFGPMRLLRLMKNTLFQQALDLQQRFQSFYSQVKVLAATPTVQQPDPLALSTYRQENKRLRETALRAVAILLAECASSSDV